MEARRRRLGFASNLTSSGASRFAVRWLLNQIGFGQMRTGARTTAFSTRENISVLCTTSVPEPMLLRACPGKAPHGVTPSAKPSADQWLIATVP
jgi:hypothetical protein